MKDPIEKAINSDNPYEELMAYMGVEMDLYFHMQRYTINSSRYSKTQWDILNGIHNRIANEKGLERAYGFVKAFLREETGYMERAVKLVEYYDTYQDNLEKAKKNSAMYHTA